MKNNQGISLIELVIVMIIIALIASFAIFNGSSSIDKAEATELYAEMTNIKKAVSGVMVKRELESGDSNWIKENEYCEQGDTGADGWYSIWGIDNENYSQSKLREKLGMSIIKRNYLVNYDTGDVILATPVTILGTSVRSYESVRALVESNKI